MSNTNAVHTLEDQLKKVAKRQTHILEMARILNYGDVQGPVDKYKLQTLLRKVRSGREELRQALTLFNQTLEHPRLPPIEAIPSRQTKVESDKLARLLEQQVRDMQMVHKLARQNDVSLVEAVAENLSEDCEKLASSLRSMFGENTSQASSGFLRVRTHS